MSCETILYVPKKFSIEEIKTIIESYLNVKVKIHQTSIPDLLEFIFKFKNAKRLMSVLFNGKTPLGRAYQLRLGADEEAKKIMKSIGKVTGGLYVPEDTSDECRMLSGMLSDEDGLPFFLKNAVVENYMRDNDDIDGLNKSIKKWKEKVNR